MTEEEVANAKKNLSDCLSCSEGVANQLFSELSADNQKACSIDSYKCQYVIDTAKMYVELTKRQAQITAWVQ